MWTIEVRITHPILCATGEVGATGVDWTLTMQPSRQELHAFAVAAAVAVADSIPLLSCRSTKE